MQYGVEHNPDNWHLYYDLGFVYFTDLKDYKKAAEVFARGAQVPDAHPFLKILAAQMATHAGDLATARMLWSATYETSQDPNIRQNAIEHLRDIQVDEDVTYLQAAVTRLGERTGHLPSSIMELILAEHLPVNPADPDGNSYLLTREDRVQVETPEDFPFITKGLPPGYKPPAQPKFHAQPL